jgi:hypothetical protein
MEECALQANGNGGAHIDWNGRNDVISFYNCTIKWNWEKFENWTLKCFLYCAANVLCFELCWILFLESIE